MSVCKFVCEIQVYWAAYAAKNVFIFFGHPLSDNNESENMTIDDKSVIIITDNKFILPILSTYDSNPPHSENLHSFILD